MSSLNYFFNNPIKLCRVNKKNLQNSYNIKSKTQIDQKIEYEHIKYHKITSSKQNIDSNLIYQSLKHTKFKSRKSQERNESLYKFPVKRILIDLRDGLDMKNTIQQVNIDNKKIGNRMSENRKSLDNCHKIYSEYKQIQTHIQQTFKFQQRKKAKQQISNIKVFARMRPVNQLQKNQSLIQYKISQKTIVFADSNFNFDYVLSPLSNQQQIYKKTVKPLVLDTLQGFNGTIFAYGQTGSGKTYTMFGNKQNKGIIPRSVETIFNQIQKDKNFDYFVSISMLEIYKDMLYDMINDNNSNLKIKQSTQNGIYIDGLVKLNIYNPKDLIILIQNAEKSRKITSTNLNQVSSRSHIIIIINIVCNSKNKEVIKSGKLYLVDLAGSQKVYKSGAVGQSFQQAKKINLSLSCLGNVINALTTKSDHVPYRDSKLTRILQDSLQGNFKTNIIVNFCPLQNCYEQTISTLKFAQRAKKIKNSVKQNINQKYSVQKLHSIINNLENQLLRTRKQLYNCIKQNSREYEQESIYELIPSERANIGIKLKGYKSINEKRKEKNSEQMEEVLTLSLQQGKEYNEQSVSFEFCKSGVKNG